MTFNGGSKSNIVMLQFENVSNDIATLLPTQFVGRSTAGRQFPGMHWVGLNNQGTVSVFLKRQQLIAPGEMATLRLAVSQKPHQSPIETVRWKD